MRSCSRFTAGALALMTAVGLVAAPSWSWAAEPPAPDETAAAVERGDGGACDRTTDLASDACDQEAREDFFLALGICVNTADAAQRRRCVQRARRALPVANAACEAQERARARVCQALGQARYDPVIRPADFVAEITNPYLPLRPGTELVYRSGDETTTVKVLRRTKRILGVRCVVVRDTVRVDGELEEDTFDYFAQDRAGNVWYFGEDTAEYAGGVPVSTDGAWIAGADGARPGIVMPARPTPGITYRQEFALDEAEDLGRVLSLGERVTVPYGTFRHVLKTFEFTPLDPEARENKFYAPGIGMILAVNLETGEREALVSVRRRP
jgi:hypothetical protein